MKLKNDRHSGESAIVFRLFIYPISIMSNLSKERLHYHFWQTPKARDFPVIQHNGTNYHLVPEEVLHKLADNNDGMFWVMIGAGVFAIAAIAALVTNKMQSPGVQIVEKPVIVTQEKIVPTNCLIFCK